MAHISARWVLAHPLQWPRVVLGLDVRSSMQEHLDSARLVQEPPVLAAQAIGWDESADFCFRFANDTADWVQYVGRAARLAD